MQLKTWWVLSWDDYYPGGALYNVNSTHFTEKEARAAAKLLEGKRDNVCVRDISNMLGIQEEKVNFGFGDEPEDE